jgi:methylenetetrahydrofolate reductase (NADPH)
LYIRDLYSQPGPIISFELFPPKNDEAEAALFRDVIPGLRDLQPAYFSVTYGAGGSTRDRTQRIVQRLRTDFAAEAMAHLTCVGSTRDTIAALLDDFHRQGIENLLCLRGDPPRGQTAFQPTPGGFEYAVDLIRFVRARGVPFSIGAAGYPEGHVECPDRQLDWDRTAAKVEAGAEFLITQLFYDVQDFLAFEDYLRRRRAVRVPIVPGVLPFLSAEQVKRFAGLCGARLPAPLRQRLDELAGDDEAVRQYGVDYCTELCRRLLDHGVPGIHLYCLNRVASVAGILRNLGLAPR